MRHHTRPSLAAVAVVLVLGLLQLLWSGVGGDGHDTSAAVLGPLSVVAGALLARVNAFETRLLVVLALLAQLGLMVLALLAGLPGEPRHPLDAQAWAALLLPAAGLLLLAADRQARRARSADARASAPYAR